MKGRTGEVLNQLAWSEREAGASAPTDRELLHRFAEGGDEAAFAALVARHSRMVLGICRRHLPTVQDAEDACQATFLILARKAQSGRWQPSVANWLYTTARQVVAKARRSAARRAKREDRAAAPDAVPVLDEISGRELLAVLDEELGNLPPLYREPLVLCYLEGLSREDAASRLGVPAGTVKTRLERGRKRLELALVRRGIGPGLGLLTLAVASPAGASPVWLAETVRVAVSGSPPAAVAALAQGAIMSRAVRKTLVAVVAATAVAGLGFVWNAAGPFATGQVPGRWSDSVPAAAPARATRAVAAAPVPKTEDEPLLKDVAVARGKAIRFLKGRQQPDGTWDGAALNFLADMEGGRTGLVLLALLEAGVPATDPVVAKGVDALAKLPPKKTYVVSLQTQVLARAGPKKHAAQIQKNVDWLVDHAIGWKDKGRVDGWSYPGNTIGDGSNTHFAVFALHAAARAGAKVDDKLWAAVRDHYLRTRTDRGWKYHDAAFDSSTSASMTGAALVGLAVAARHDKNPDAGREAFDLGMKWFLPAESTKSDGYLKMVIAELGRTTGSPAFKSGDKVVAWYRDGATKLIKEQQPNGSWVLGKGVDADEVLSTAFALYFLGPEEKGAIPVRAARTAAAAPVPKAEDEQFLKGVTVARGKAVRFLKGRQQPDGTWDGAVLKGVADMDGGGTGLVLLALLEAGVPATDPVVAKGVDALAKLPPKKTYVVSLQTQVLARAGPKKHAAQIQKNVDWLVDHAIGWKDKGRVDGWSYPGNTIGDGSNTHFAVFALHAAARAGAKVDDKFWSAVRDYYVRTQQDGGWAYTNLANGAAPVTESMTTAGLVGLAVADWHEKKASGEAFERGMKRLLATPGDRPPTSAGYLMLTTAELGRTTKAAVFKSGDKVVAWYRDGATKLIKEQQPNGSWVLGKGVDADEVLSTAFALYFLGPEEK